MSEHERRALNEALFRDVNERIAENAENSEADKTEFVCECADPSCTERVPATLAEYENVRKKSTTFLLAPGHGEPDIDTLVLGCTHFPALTSTIAAAAGPTIRIVDSAATTAVAVAHELATRGLLWEAGQDSGHAALRLLATDSPERFASVGGRFLAEPLVAADVELVDI